MGQVPYVYTWASETCRQWQLSSKTVKWIQNGKMRSYNFYKMDVSLLSSYCSAKRIEVCGPRKKMANVALCRSFSKISSRDSVCSAVGVLPLSVQESIDKGMSIDEVSPYYEIGETDFGDHGK
ncbi:hypothetical protein V6N13_108724 [Hibiscus sabdariffa]